MKISKGPKILFKLQKKFLVIGFHPAGMGILYAQSFSGRLKVSAHESYDITAEKEDFFKKAFKFFEEFTQKYDVRSKDVIFSVSDATYIHISYLVLPVLPEDELVAAARWQLKEETTFDLEKALFDWQLIREFKDEEGIKRGFIFIAAEKGFVDQCLSFAQECNLNVLALTNPFFNYPDILADINSTDKIVAILEINEKNSMLGIYNENKLCLVRELPFSLGKIALALTSALVTEKGRISLSLEDAKKMLSSYGVIKNGAMTVDGNFTAGQLMDLMRPSLETIIRELKFSFEYFSSRFDEKQPSKLFITSEASRLNNLSDFLREQMNTPVAILPSPPWIDVSDFKRDIENSQNNMVDLLAATAADTHSVNLLPLEMKEKNIRLLQMGLLRVGTFTLVSIFLLLIFVIEFRIQDYSNRIRISKVHLEKVKVIEGLSEKILLREKLLRDIQSAEVSVIGVLKVISRGIPDDIILSQVEFVHSNDSVRIKGTIRGKLEKSEGAEFQFIKNLEESSIFNQVRLVSSAAAVDQQEFEIEANLLR